VRIAVFWQRVDTADITKAVWKSAAVLMKGMVLMNTQGVCVTVAGSETVAGIGAVVIAADRFQGNDGN
jgi:hypothetical protein